MGNDLIIGEELIFLKTCGDGEVFKTLNHNLQYFVDVSRDIYETADDKKTLSAYKNPILRAKIVEQWFRDNDGTDGIKTFGLWKVIQRHNLNPDKIFPLLALYVVQCEIKDCISKTKNN